MPASPRFRSLSVVEVLIAATLLLVLAVLFMPAFVGHRHGTMHRTKCSNTLRQIGLAAIQYGDDKRFLPHAGPTRELDGDAETSDTPRAVRALLWFGYHDNPEGWICGASDDFHQPIDDDAVRANLRLWGWERNHAAVGSDRDKVSPWDETGGVDPALVETSELSYAYTRRGYNRNVRSDAILGSDRGPLRDPERARPDPSRPGEIGNHNDTWNVLRADGTVEGVGEHQTLGSAKQPAWEALTGTERGQGALPLSPGPGGGPR